MKGSFFQNFVRFQMTSISAFILSWLGAHTATELAEEGQLQTASTLCLAGDTSIYHSGYF